MSLPTTPDSLSASSTLANPAAGLSNDPAGSAAPTQPSQAMKRTRIVPAKGWQPLDLKELWRYRELTGFLALRDIKVRYKQTILGAAWAIIQPVMQTLVFTGLLNQVGGIEAPPGQIYALWVFCAMVPWQLFENAISNAGNSLVGSQNLITKVYFPRLTIPVATILAGLLDFAIGMAILAGLMVFYGKMPGLGIVLLPLLTLYALVASLAAGLWLSALNVKYRDVRYAIPFLARIWFFLTPVVYPATKVREKLGPFWEGLYALNPMAGVVEGFRWALLRTEPPSPTLVGISSVATFILLVGGLYYFRRTEQSFADIV